MTCLTPESFIATPRGERAVESLRPGDKVITRLNGIRTIRWVGRREIAGRALALAEHLNPILIRAGALGRRRPERDLVVSPNLRLRVAGDLPLVPSEAEEVVAAAKHLTGCDGVHVLHPLRVTYILPLFDTYEEVLVNGTWVEIFHPADALVRPGGNAQRTEMNELFPDHAPVGTYTVRPPQDGQEVFAGE